MPSLFTHRLYQDQRLDWRFFRLTYQGGRDYLDRYLFQHPKERDEWFRRRLERGIHPNFSRSIIDRWASLTYHKPVARSTDNSRLDEWWGDLDMLGNSADQFWERGLQLRMRGGRVAIVVDRHDPDLGPGQEPVQTRADEIAVGRRPFAMVVDTEDIVDWDVDRRGRLRWVVIREEADEARDWGTDPGARRFNFRVWTSDEWILFAETAENDQAVQNTQGDVGRAAHDVVEVARGSHPVGRVPIVFTFWGVRRGVELIGESALKDIAPQNRRLTNQVSLIDEQIYQHVFNILVVPNATYKELKGVQFSVAGVIPVPDQAAFVPTYIGPDVSQIGAIREEIRETIQNIRTLSGLGRQNEDGLQQPSGRALSFMAMDKIAMLRKTAMSQRDAEATVYEFMLRWDGIDGSSQDMQQLFELNYDTDFHPEVVNQALEDALAYASLNIPGEGAIENAIQATRSRFRDAVDSERLNAILANVEEQLRNRPAAPQVGTQQQRVRQAVDTLTQEPPG